ncbi:MAG: nuclear transport factor 2 family protein [Planctomycetaceae bacterium]
MIYGMTVLLCAFTLNPGPHGFCAQDEVDELSRLETSWNDAHLNGDSSALDQLWADDLVVTVPNMNSMNKAQSLAVWKTGRFKFDRYQTSNVKIRVYGDAAVVTGRLQRTRTLGERKLEDDWLYTKTYVKADGKWRVVAFHASPAPADAE